MAFARIILVKVGVALIAPALLGWYVGSFFFRYEDVPSAPTGAVTVCAILAAWAVASGWLWLAAAAIRRAVDAGAASTTEERREAASSALRLPGRVGTLLVIVSTAVIATMAVVETRAGVPLDVALAGAAAGLALALMSGMLGYSMIAAAVAPMIVEFGSVELRHRGTVRGKVLVVCAGLLVITTLLVGSVTYARYRMDTDRVYLEEAAAVHERAAAWAQQHGVESAAEVVFAATGAPTAAVRDGVVEARAGIDDARALVEGLPAGDGVEIVDGGWRVRRVLPQGAALVTSLSDAPLRARREAFLRHTAALAATLLAAAAVLVWVAARTLAVPILLLGNAARRIAEGDLTVNPPSVSRDEMGQLASDFRKMAQGLAGLVTDVQAASRGVQEGTREMDEIGERVKGGAREEHERVVAVQVAVEAMHESVALVDRGVDALSEYVHSTSAAVGGMAAALEEVRRQAQELEGRTGSAGGDVEKLSDAGRRAQKQLGALDDLAGSAQGTLASVSASLSGLETSAVAGQLAAAQAAELADHAGGVVQETVAGMESLRSAVDDAKRRVAVLGRRSDDIDQILDFIGEVAGRTNLLSLNASIIATQAGEHGKAFAVVADQIRELAAQISSSTKSIGEIIRAVRDDVSGTARLIDRGDALAGDGVARARKSLDALHSIRTATARGHETAAAIRDAVQLHAQSTRDVSSLVASVAQNSHSLSEAVQMVGKSVAAVGSVSRAVGALADKVSRALEEQSGAGRRQLETLERIDTMLADITRAVESHDVATRRVREALEHLGLTAAQHEAAVVELSGVAGRLGGRSRSLAERVGKFKIELHG